jgi:hypothetical protein
MRYLLPSSSPWFVNFQDLSILDSSASNVLPSVDVFPAGGIKKYAIFGALGLLALLILKK